MAGYRTFWLEHDQGETAEAVQIRIQQMSVIVARAPIMFLAVAFNAILTVAIAADSDNLVFGAVWAAILTLMSGFAFFRWRTRARKEAPDHVSERGPRRLARIATLQGLIWGIGAALLMPADPMPAQSVVGLTVAAMGAGGAMVLSTVPAASIGFTIACVLPLTIRYLTFGDLTYLMLAAMCAMFIAVLLTMARSVYRSFIGAIQAQVANQGLLTELSDTRATLLDAISSIREGFAQFNESGELTEANDRFGTLLGIPPDQVREGRDFGSLLRQGNAPMELGDDMAAYERWIRRNVADHKRGKDGLIEHFREGHWVSLHHNRTSLGGTVTTLVDVSNLMERESELIAARVQAETADRAKSEFLALMSHELRTPLNSILGFSELFMIEAFGTHKDQRYRDHAKDIHESGSHLLHIINELLDLSKVEAGFFELGAEPVSVRDAIVASHRMLIERAHAQGISVHYDVPAGCPDLLSDPRVLKQMLINVLGNAIKFTRDGKDVTIQAELRDDRGITISIIDKGIGVHPDEIPKIMKPFGQVESGLNRMVQQGTGLGLPLVKQMIELHGGTLLFQSTPGVGTTVQLIFPPERSVSQS